MELARDLILPIIGALVAGAIIGMEREYRDSPAGFRTHILVALTSSFLMLGAVHQMEWLSGVTEEVVRIDPVRMAHGILTGIGFLCGGVIFREAASVRGLTTAASLWATSGLGILFGVGFYGLAISATITTLAVLAAAELTGRLIPRKHYAELTVRYPRSIDAMTRFGETMKAHNVSALAVSERVSGEIHELTTTVSWKRGKHERALAATLAADPEVLGFDLLSH